MYIFHFWTPEKTISIFFRFLRRPSSALAAQVAVCLQVHLVNAGNVHGDELPCAQYGRGAAGHTALVVPVESKGEE